MLILLLECQNVTWQIFSLFLPGWNFPCSTRDAPRLSIGLVQPGTLFGQGGAGTSALLFSLFFKTTHGQMFPNVLIIFCDYHFFCVIEHPDNTFAMICKRHVIFFNWLPPPNASWRLQFVDSKTGNKFLATSHMLSGIWPESGVEHKVPWPQRDILLTERDRSMRETLL